MARAATVILIKDAPEAHGVYATVADQRRTVYCTVRSVGQKEAYQARAVGLNPEIVLIVPQAIDYHDETRCEFEGTEYKILRTYHNDNDAVELTLQRLEVGSLV